MRGVRIALFVSKRVINGLPLANRLDAVPGECVISTLGEKTRSISWVLGEHLALEYSVFFFLY